MRPFTLSEQAFYSEKMRFISSTTLHTTMFHLPTVLLVTICDVSSSAIATRVITSTGRDTPVRLDLLSRLLFRTDTVCPGTSRFFDINNLEKPAGWQDQSG